MKPSVIDNYWLRSSQGQGHSLECHGMKKFLCEAEPMPKL